MRVLTRIGALVLALFLAICLSLPLLLAQGMDEPSSTASVSESLSSETEESCSMESSSETGESTSSESTSLESASSESTSSEPASSEPASSEALEEPIDPPACPDSQIPPPETEKALSEPEADQEPETVSTWGGLTAWLDRNWQTGGTVRLDADVTASGIYDFMNGKLAFEMQPVTVDCGEHTIYIEGGSNANVAFTSSDFNLTIQGQGGEEGLLHVRTGSILTLDMLNIEAAQGNAVVQDEGGILILTHKDLGYEAPPRVTGEIVYADKPVFISRYRPDPYLAVVPDGQQVTRDLLPPAVKGTVNYRGVMSNPLEQPVEWDLESAPEALVNRTRAILTGHIAGELTWNGQTWPEGDYITQYQPTCIVAFLESGAALLELRLERGAEFLQGAVYFQVTPGADTLRLLVSTDEGENWVEHASLSGAGTTDRGFVLYLEEPDYPVWMLVEAIYPDGDIIHTDTVSVDEDDIRPADWIDGHRGGGESLLPPPDTVLPSERPGDSTRDETPEDGTGSAASISSKGTPALILDTDSISAPEQSIAPSMPEPDQVPVIAGTELPPPLSAAPDTKAVASSSSDTPIVPQPPAIVQPVPDTPATVPVQEPEPELEPETGTNGLSSGLQVLLGITAAVTLCGGAILFFNPSLLRKRHKN